MKLDKTKTGEIYPVDNVHLFQHCADGMISVSEQKFTDSVLPLLIIHGVKYMDLQYMWVKP